MVGLKMGNFVSYLGSQNVRIDAPSSMPSLIVMVINKDKCPVRRHETPAFSPVPIRKENLKNIYMYSFTITL